MANLREKYAQYPRCGGLYDLRTLRANAYRILEDTLNLRDVRIYDTVEDADGKQKRVLNKKETTLAQQKQQLSKMPFVIGYGVTRADGKLWYRSTMSCLTPLVPVNTTGAISASAV
jgi:hypothetical protein